MNKTVKMATAIQIEANTSGAENFTSAFFFKQPVDGTKNKVCWHQFLPTTGFKEETETVVFNFPAMDFPHCYEISDLLISVKFNILTEDGKLPKETDYVVGINNMLHSLFKTVTLKINGEIVSSSPEFYYYKAYLENLLTFSKNVKQSWLQSVGWGDDLEGSMWHTHTSPGYQKRAMHFREGLIPSARFTDEGKVNHFKTNITFKYNK